MAHSTSLPENILDSGWLDKPVDIFNEKVEPALSGVRPRFEGLSERIRLDNQGKEVFRHTEELAYVVGTGVERRYSRRAPGQLFV